MLGFIVTLLAGAVHIPWILGAGRGRRWWKLALALAAAIDLVIVVAIATSGVWVSVMWFTELAQASVFWTIFAAKARLFAYGSLWFLLFLWANAMFIRWKLKKEGFGQAKRGAAPFVLPTYYLTIVIGFTLQGACAGAMYGQNPSFLTERFPTEVRATAAAFCYHQGAIFAGSVGPVIAWLATTGGMGFAKPMLIFTAGGLVSFVLALLLGPETLGKEMVADLEIVAVGDTP